MQNKDIIDNYGALTLFNSCFRLSEATEKLGFSKEIVCSEIFRKASEVAEAFFVKEKVVLSELGAASWDLLRESGKAQYDEKMASFLDQEFDSEHFQTLKKDDFEFSCGTYSSIDEFLQDCTDFEKEFLKQIYNLE